MFDDLFNRSRADTSQLEAKTSSNETNAIQAQVAQSIVSSRMQGAQQFGQSVGRGVEALGTGIAAGLDPVAKEEKKARLARAQSTIRDESERSAAYTAALGAKDTTLGGFDQPTTSRTPATNPLAYDDRPPNSVDAPAPNHAQMAIDRATARGVIPQGLSPSSMGRIQLALDEAGATPIKMAGEGDAVARAGIYGKDANIVGHPQGRLSDMREHAYDDAIRQTLTKDPIVAHEMAERAAVDRAASAATQRGLPEVASLTRRFYDQPHKLAAASSVAQVARRSVGPLPVNGKMVTVDEALDHQWSPEEARNLRMGGASRVPAWAFDREKGLFHGDTSKLAKLMENNSAGRDYVSAHASDNVFELNNGVVGIQAAGNLANTLTDDAPFKGDPQAAGAARGIKNFLSSGPAAKRALDRAVARRAYGIDVPASDNPLDSAAEKTAEGLLTQVDRTALGGLIRKDSPAATAEFKRVHEKSLTREPVPVFRQNPLVDALTGLQDADAAEVLNETGEAIRKNPDQRALVDHLVGAGLSPDEARTLAGKNFHNLAYTLGEVRSGIENYDQLSPFERGEVDRATISTFKEGLLAQRRPVASISRNTSTTYAPISRDDASGILAKAFPNARPGTPVRYVGADGVIIDGNGHEPVGISKRPKAGSKLPDQILQWPETRPSQSGDTQSATAGQMAFDIDARANPTLVATAAAQWKTGGSGVRDADRLMSQPVEGVGSLYDLWRTALETGTAKDPDATLYVRSLIVDHAKEYGKTVWDVQQDLHQAAANSDDPTIRSLAITAEGMFNAVKPDPKLLQMAHQTVDPQGFMQTSKLAAQDKKPKGAPGYRMDQFESAPLNSATTGGQHVAEDDLPPGSTEWTRRQPDVQDALGAFMGGTFPMFSGSDDRPSVVNSVGAKGMEALMGVGRSASAIMRNVGIDDRPAVDFIRRMMR